MLRASSRTRSASTDRVTGQQRRRRQLDETVAVLFDASKRTYGSPRIHRDQLERIDARFRRV